MSKSVKTAVVLAGGSGSRLSPLTNDRPKPMVSLLGKPILHWVVEWLKSNGITNLVIGVAYCKESVMDYFKDGTELGVKISYSVHSVEGETGEGFRLAISRHVADDLFVALNGDEITNFKLDDLIRYHLKNKPVATIAVAHPSCPFGVVNANEDGLVYSFVEKPLLHSLLTSIGIYLFSRQILDYLPRRDSVERATFPLLAKKGLLRAYAIDGTWLTINTMKDLESAKVFLKEHVGNGTWLE
jgi:mannose-1-phosphate guanylyltransferase